MAHLKKALVCLLCLLSVYYSFSQDQADLIKPLINSTVTIKAVYGGTTKMGTGFFVAPHLIVTNYHVIKNAVSATCTLDDPSKSFKIEGSVSEDDVADLVLLKVSGANALPIKISESPVAPGDQIFIIGRPLGSTVLSEGSISSLKEEQEGVKKIVVSSYASLDNSGGPLLNVKGEVIGVSLGSKEGLRTQLAVSRESLTDLLASKSDTVLSLAQLNAPDQEAAPDPTADLPRDAQVDVNTVDFKNNLLPNEIIIFKSKNNNGEFQGITDSTGRFSLRLPAGDEYDIFILGFKDSTSYNVLKIPALAKKEFYKKPFKVEVKFQPPHTFVLEDCNFNSGKATLMPESFAVLDELVKYLNRKEDDRIELGGHTDNVGLPATNLKLSLDRANTVRDYLLSKGIDPARVVAKGYGSTKPVADNKTAEGRATNRRTEVTVL